jgi:hypothetical protein
MTSPPNDRSHGAGNESPPVSFEKPGEQPFDPYRFGAPEHPVPPEYAPPGYVPPPAQAPPTRALPPVYPEQPPPQYSGYPPQSGQYPYPVPPPWMTQYPQPHTGNGKAVAALVLGIVSILLCWLSIFDIVPVVLAIVFGALARGEAGRVGGKKGMATTGIVLGIVGALLATVFTVVVYARIKDCLDTYDQGSSEYNTCIRHKF